jgi:hypothetical protein
MKSLKEFLTESKTIKGTKYPTILPDDVKNVIVDHFKNVPNIKDKTDVYEYLDYAADEVWDYIFTEYGSMPERLSSSDIRAIEIIWPHWGKDIIKAVLGK